MGTVYVDAAVGDDLRRERLYAGELFAYSPGPTRRRSAASRATWPRRSSLRTIRPWRRTR